MRELEDVRVYPWLLGSDGCDIVKIMAIAAPQYVMGYLQ